MIEFEIYRMLLLHNPPMADKSPEDSVNVLVPAEVSPIAKLRLCAKVALRRLRG
jgi:hypothetical protein